MTDFMAFRDEVERLREGTDHADMFASVSVTGLAALYNRIAPPALVIADASNMQLTVFGTGGLISGKDASAVIDHVSRAVASIGQEIRQRSQSLSRTDYVKAPVFTSGPPGGPIVFSARSGSSLPNEQTVDSLSEQAMARLVNLLPATDHDEHLMARVVSARMQSARAISEMALAAKRVHGLRITLRGGGEDVDAVVDLEQADLIGEAIRSESTQVTRQVIDGRLDGMRYRRREFFLDTENGADVHGSIDEALIPNLRGLLDRPVRATVERIASVDGAGRRRRPAYRLVAIGPQPPALPLD